MESLNHSKHSCYTLLLLDVQVGEDIPRRISVPFVLDLVGNGGRDVLSAGLWIVELSAKCVTGWDACSPTLEIQPSVMSMPAATPEDVQVDLSTTHLAL